MRVIHVVPAITEEASGPSYCVPRLCESLIGTGVDVHLAALDWSSVPVSLPYLKTFPLGLGPRRLGVSPSMRRWLEEEAASGRVDLIHNHSLWMMPNIYSGWACKKGRCRLVVSPHGTLSAWALGRSALQKKIFWHLLQAPALREAACFHATAESEYDDIRRLGFRQPVAIIPNGIDIPEGIAERSRNSRTLLFLGRIHQKKGLDMLLPAWAAVQGRFPEWHLKIVGPDDGGYLRRMRQLADKLGLKRVDFTGALLGEAKWQAYRDADLFVLPTYSENFGLSVAEALASGIPAIVTKGAPWCDLEDRGVGWWIDISVSALVASLDRALSRPRTELDAMGTRGREWMKADFSWKRVCETMRQTYSWVRQGGAPPPWVRSA